jgi:hypothetical protein
MKNERHTCYSKREGCLIIESDIGVQEQFFFQRSNKKLSPVSIMMKKE